MYVKYPQVYYMLMYIHLLLGTHVNYDSKNLTVYLPASNYLCIDITSTDFNKITLSPIRP